MWCADRCVSPGHGMEHVGAVRSTRARTRLKALLLVSWLATVPVLAALPTTRTLDRDWSFRLAPLDMQAHEHAAATQWRAATVPGHVHTDLFANHFIPDPH